jgi:hypothetical protein
MTRSDFGQQNQMEENDEVGLVRKGCNAVFVQNARGNERDADARR